MFKLVVFVFIVVLAGCSPAPPPAPSLATVDASAEIRPVVEKILEGWMSLDPSKVASFYAKDAGAVFYDIAPLKYNGWDEYSQGFQKLAVDWKSIQFKLIELQASKQGNVAWASYIVDGVITPKKGDQVKAQVRSTDIFEKRGNDWIVVHEHVSIPFPEPPPGAAETKKK